MKTQNKIASTRHETCLYWFILFFLIAVVALKFTGINNHYFYLFNFLENIRQFKNDIYINNTFFSHSTIFIFLNDIFNFQTSDIKALTLHVICSLISIYFVYKILEFSFPDFDRVGFALLLLCLAFKGRNIPVNTWGGIIPMQPASATTVAVPLAFATLWCLLRRRHGIAAVLLSILLLFHILGDFIVFIVFLLFLLLDSQRRPRDFLWLALPVAALLIKKLISPLSIEMGADTRVLFDAVMEYGSQDASFPQQGVVPLILFAVSFAVFPYMLRRVAASVPAETIRLARAVYWSALLVIVGSLFHEFVLAPNWPVPVVAMLGPVRAMNHYTVFFYLFAFAILLRSGSIGTFLRAATIGALVIVHGENLRGLIYPVALIAAGFAADRIAVAIHQRERLAAPLFRQSIVVAGLALVLTLQIHVGGVYGTNFNREGWKYLDRWTLQIRAPEDVWAAIATLRDHENDYMLLPLYRLPTGRIRHTSVWNVLAHKSTFIELGHHFYFNRELWLEHKKREALVNRLKKALDDKQPVPADILAALDEYDVVVAVPATLAPLFGDISKKRVSGPYAFLSFGPDIGSPD
jgi:hypothetical protein